MGELEGVRGGAEEDSKWMGGVGLGETWLYPRGFREE